MSFSKKKGCYEYKNGAVRSAVLTLRLTPAEKELIMSIVASRKQSGFYRDSSSDVVIMAVSHCHEQLLSNSVF